MWYFSGKENITLADIFEFEDNLNWNKMSKNSFKKYNKILDARIENYAARIIQRKYKERIYNPSHSYIQGILKKSFETYTSSNK